MMELTGKYLRLELSSAAMGNFFGKDPKPGPRWDLIGEVRGETSGIGLWFHLIALGVDGVDPTWQPEARAVSPDPDRQGARRQRVLPAALGAGDRQDPGAGAALRDPRHPPLPAGAGPPSADDTLADPPLAGVIPGQQGFL